MAIPTLRKDRSSIRTTRTIRDPLNGTEEDFCEYEKGYSNGHCIKAESGIMMLKIRQESSVGVFLYASSSSRSAISRMCQCADLWLVIYPFGSVALKGSFPLPVAATVAKKDTPDQLICTLITIGWPKCFSVYSHS